MSVPMVFRHAAAGKLFSDVNPKLKAYIEEQIFPQYAKNEWGHQIGHINYVIRRSFEFATQVADQAALNPDIIYTVAAYHDLGHYVDAAHHEKVSAKMLRADEKLGEFFSPAEIETIAEAIEDHRSHCDRSTRSVYGRIVTSADCNIKIDVMLHRTYTYRIRNFSNLSLDEVVEESRWHLAAKYGKNGYALNKMFFDDPEFEEALKELQALTGDERLFRERFLRINHLERADKLQRQLDKYLEAVDDDLKVYVETKVFPQYAQNERAHGILHVREVMRRAFLLNDVFRLGLSPDLIYAIVAYHDLGKHIDSDRHEFVSARLFLEDAEMAKFFSDEERKIIAEAIEDHRHSKADAPRSVYGKLISSADRNTRVEMVFIRSFFVGKDRQPETMVADFLDETFRRLAKRYSEDDPEKMFYADDEYRDFLAEMRQLLYDEAAFKEKYCEVNQISSREHTLAEEPGVEVTSAFLV